MRRLAFVNLLLRANDAVSARRVLFCGQHETVSSLTHDNAAVQSSLAGLYAATDLPVKPRDRRRKTTHEENNMKKTT
jgi:hypothetical protein